MIERPSTRFWIALAIISFIIIQCLLFSVDLKEGNKEAINVIISYWAIFTTFVLYVF